GEARVAGEERIDDVRARSAPARDRAERRRRAGPLLACEDLEAVLGQRDLRVAREVGGELVERAIDLAAIQPLERGHGAGLGDDLLDGDGDMLVCAHERSSGSWDVVSMNLGDGVGEHLSAVLRGDGDEGLAVATKAAD